MKFYTEIKLEGINLVSYESRAKETFSENGNQDNLLLTDVKNMPGSNPYLCMREFGSFELKNYNKITGCLVYDDFVVESNGPKWLDLMSSRIVKTTAEEDYGPEQGLKVAESLIYKNAKARIRCQQSTYNNAGCVFTVKIVAHRNDSLKDALHLHALILSGKI